MKSKQISKSEKEQDGSGIYWLKQRSRGNSGLPNSLHFLALSFSCQFHKCSVLQFCWLKYKRMNSGSRSLRASHLQLLDSWVQSFCTSTCRQSFRKASQTWSMPWITHGSLNDRFLRSLLGFCRRPPCSWLNASITFCCWPKTTKWKWCWISSLWFSYLSSMISFTRHFQTRSLKRYSVDSAINTRTSYKSSWLPLF